MANAKAKLYYTKEKYLSTLPIENGNIIFVPESNKVCLDMNGERFSYNTIKILDTEQERAEMPFPNEGFYFVRETNVLWRWNNSWGKITSSGLNPVVYGNAEEDFPEIGALNTLYYTDEGIYNWKSQLNKYNLIANANTWETI